MNTDNLDEFGKNLKLFREQKGMTQRTLATKVGITAASISAYEGSLKNPSLDIVLSISNALNVSLDELIGINPKPTKIETLGQFISIFCEVLKSPMAEIREDEYGTREFELHDSIKEYKSKIFDMVNLFKNKTIDEELFDLWVKNEAKKNANVKIIDIINESNNPDAGLSGLSATDSPF